MARPWRVACLTDLPLRCELVCEVPVERGCAWERPTESEALLQMGCARARRARGHGAGERTCRGVVSSGARLAARTTRESHYCDKGVGASESNGRLRHAALPCRDVERIAVLRLRDPKAKSGVKVAGLFALDIRTNAQGRMTTFFGPSASPCDESASSTTSALVGIHDEPCDLSERFRIQRTVRVNV
jgi:hypothetical protein